MGSVVGKACVRLQSTSLESLFFGGMWRHWVVCKGFWVFFQRKWSWCVFQVACTSGGEVFSISPMSISACEPRGPNTENILDMASPKSPPLPFSSSVSLIPSLFYTVTLCLSSLLRVIYIQAVMLLGLLPEPPRHTPFKNTESDRDAALFVIT